MTEVGALSVGEKKAQMAALLFDHGTLPVSDDYHGETNVMEMNGYFLIFYRMP